MLPGLTDPELFAELGKVEARLNTAEEGRIKRTPTLILAVPWDHTGRVVERRRRQVNERHMGKPPSGRRCTFHGR